MIVRTFFEAALSQVSYLLGCTASGQAIVIDPHRDIDVYLAAAAGENLRVTHVTETHIHADFVSGSRALAHRTGATLLLSDEGDADWKYGFAGEAQLIRGGDRITVGNILIDVVHTPGHTPEHLALVVTDGAVADAPIAAITGDFLFVGDVGRPDLLERAVNVRGSMEKGARALYRSLTTFNDRYEAWLQIWPGHRAGSSCGKGISAVPHSTLGYERRFNWALKSAGEEAFIAEVLAGQPDPPTYFAAMKRINRDGPPRDHGFAMPPRLDDGRLAEVVREGALVIDTRAAADYAAGFLPGTLNLPLTASFVTWAGWLVPQEETFYLLLDRGAEGRLPEIVRSLALIGLDRIGGYFGPGAMARALAGASPARIRQITPEELARMRGDDTPAVIDVRNDSEWREGHLPAAVHVPLGRLQARIAELPQGQPLVMQCQAGARSAIAASLLYRAGVRDVSNLAGGFAAWEAAGLPVAR